MHIFMFRIWKRYSQILYFILCVIQYVKHPALHDTLVGDLTKNLLITYVRAWYFGSSSNQADNKPVVFGMR